MLRVDAVAESGRKSVSKYQPIRFIQPECGQMSGLTRAGREGRPCLARPNSRYEQGQERGKHVPCPADHEQDWQPYPVDPYSAEESADHT